jgi:hypothetical protein
MADIGVIVSTAATAAIAVFAWRTWKLSDAQHKLYNDPELRIHPWPEADIASTAGANVALGLASSIEEKRDRVQYVQYQVGLVNPGSVPITVTDIREDAITADSCHHRLSMRPASPLHSPPGWRFMSDVPSFISGREFAICSRWLSLVGEYEGLRDSDFAVRVTLTYHNGQRSRTITHNPPLRRGYGEAYPGQRAGASPASAQNQAGAC